MWEVFYADNLDNEDEMSWFFNPVMEVGEGVLLYYYQNWQGSHPPVPTDFNCRHPAFSFDNVRGEVLQSATFDTHLPKVSQSTYYVSDPAWAHPLFIFKP